MQAELDKPVETHHPYGVMFSRVMGYMQQSWMGIHQGIFGLGVPAEAKPSDKCFGKWNVDNSKLIHDFGKKTEGSIAAISLKDWHDVILNTADFVLANNEYCHVADTVNAIRHFCKIGDNCRWHDVHHRFAHHTIEFLMHGVPIFNMFEKKGWFHQNDEERGAACFKIGKTVGDLFRSLWQFDADVLVQTAI